MKGISPIVIFIIIVIFGAMILYIGWRMGIIPIGRRATEAECLLDGRKLCERFRKEGWTTAVQTEFDKLFGWCEDHFKKHGASKPTNSPSAYAFCAAIGA